VRKEGPALYAKTIDRLGLYQSTQFKNGSDIKKRMMSGKVIKSSLPDLANNHTAHDNRVWEYQMNELRKSEHTLETL